MTRKLLSLLVVLGMGTVVATAYACDEHKKKDEKTAAKTTSGQPGCPKGCDPTNCKFCTNKGAALTAVEDGRSESAEKSPCGSKTKLTATEGEKAPCAHAAKAQLTAVEGEKKPCHMTAKEGDDGCPIRKRVHAVLTAMPSMKYKVGDEVTGCASSAAKLAEANGGTIAYVVGDDTFTDQGEATARLVKALEDEIAGMTAMQFAVGEDCVRCPVSAKALAKKSDKPMMYRVAGIDFECKEKAEKALTAVKAALEEVQITYKVGEKTTPCNETAGKLAKENGGRILYVVGDEETPCAKTAQLKLDQAKVHAIVEAAATVAAS